MPPAPPQAQEDQVRRQRAHLLAVFSVQVAMYMAADQGQSCAQQTVSTCFVSHPTPTSLLVASYVQELEARLLHMESLFQQVTPILEQVGANGLDPNGTALAGVPQTQTVQNPNLLQSVLPQMQQYSRSSSSDGASSGGDPNTPIKLEDDVSETFGQLALDEHGHMRWIGGSSTMSLIQSFRAMTTSPLHRVSPMEEDPSAPGPSVNKLYFPATVFFGKVRALPMPEEVEYPDRDLADKLVSGFSSTLIDTCRDRVHRLKRTSQSSTS